MKKSEREALSQHSVEELQAAIKEARETLLKGRIEQVTDNSGLGGKAKDLRRNIARMLTIIKQKEQAEVQA